MVYIALLRAVNVGGRKLLMADLRDMASRLGLANVTTLLQSGNLVFTSSERSSDALARRLEAETEARFKLRTDYFVRSAREWKTTVAGNPFAREAVDDPSHLVLFLFNGPVGAPQAAALTAAIRGREYVHVAGSHAYAVYPDGIGESKLTISVVESKAGYRTAGRNWNTVLKLLALAG